MSRSIPPLSVFVSIDRLWGDLYLEIWPCYLFCYSNVTEFSLKKIIKHGEIIDYLSLFENLFTVSSILTC